MSTHRGVLLLPRTEKPTAKCLICSAEFYRDQPEEYQRHVARCARQHIDDLRALAPSARNAHTIFGEDMKDHEAERHWRAVRKRMADEGRTEAHPNEIIVKG